MSDTFEIVEENLLFEGRRFALSRVMERAPDGETRVRELIRHPGAAVVVPVRDDGRVVLVRQHRTAAGQELLELPAGIIDEGESPLQTAQRELREETGYRADSWAPLVTFFPAPGVSDQRMHVFLATSLKSGEPSPEPDEFLQVVELTVDQLRARLLNQELEDGKTLTALLYVMFVGMESSPESMDP